MTLWEILKDQRGFFGGINWGNIFSNVATTVLGSLISGGLTQGLNAAFGPSPPSRRDVQRDLEMQANVMREATTPRAPIRTPEQEESDRLAVEQTKARQATFSKLSGEYDALQKAGPQVFWNPYEEEQIKQEAMAEAAMRGMGESGQAQQHVSRRLDEARLRRSQEASRLHNAQLSDLRTQMGVFGSVVQPGAGIVSTPPAPSVNPLPRTTEPFVKNAPIDITAALREDEKKGKAPASTTSLASQIYGVSPGTLPPEEQEQYALYGR